MKLCLINPTRMRRAVVYGLSKQLAKRKNYEITILQPSKRYKSSEKTFSKRIDDKIEILHFPCFFLPNIHYNIPFFHKEIDLLVRLLSERECEIVQACDYDYLSSIAPIFMKRKYNVPTVLTTDALPGYTWFYGNIVVDAVAKQYTYSIGKRILDSYDKLVLLYRRLRGDVMKLGISREKIEVIPNGIDPEKFKRNVNVKDLKSTLSIRDDEKVILFVGRLAVVKRIWILIRLTEKLLQEGFNVKTIIVGEGPDKKRLQRLSWSLKKNIVFAGYVPHDEIYKYYRLADVFVLPSLSEGFPTVLLEASASSTPCVASNVNGVSDIVVHNETGFLVEKSDVDSYLYYVKLLLADEDLLKNMGKNALEYVKRNLNWHVITQKYDEMYRWLVN